MPETAIQPDLTIKGKAPERKDDDWLLLLAILTFADVTEGQDWWAQIAPTRYRTMLTGQGWTYNPSLMQWTRGSAPLPSATVKNAVIVAATEAENEAAGLARLLTTGALNLRAWFDQMLAMVKRTQVAVAAVARGGVDQLPASELARTVERIPASPAQVQSTGDMVVYQVDRLQRFAEQIEKGIEGADTAEKIENRAKLYVRQAIAGYEEARRRTGAAIGVKDAINVLDSAAEHCLPSKTDPLPDCPSIRKAGWMPLEAMPPIGLRRCRMNCRCQLAFRLADGTELP